MDFDERQLRTFIAIAETGSLGRASRQVHLTQPSLSRLIQSMEDRLGHRLFDRDSRGMALTAAGELLLPRARLLVFEMQATRDDLDALRGLRRGTVRVGAVAAVLRTLVAQALGRMLAANPDLTVEAREAVDGELLDALVNRQVDLVVTAGQPDNPEVECLGTCAYADRFAVFAAADHPLPDRPSLADLADQSWVMPGGGYTPRHQFEAILADLGLRPPRVAAESASVEAMIAISAHSRLLCWFPEPLLAPYLASGVMRRLTVPALECRRTFVLLRRNSGMLPAAAREFLRHIPLA